DRLIGRGAKQYIDGGPGYDRIEGRGGEDEIDGGPGDDTIDGGDGDDAITGGGGDDWLDGDFGNDALEGEDGDDVLLGRGGDALLRAGGGLGRRSGHESIGLRGAVGTSRDVLSCDSDDSAAVDVRDEGTSCDRKVVGRPSEKDGAVAPVIARESPGADVIRG